MLFTVKYELEIDTDDYTDEEIRPNSIDDVRDAAWDIIKSSLARKEKLSVFNENGEEEITL